MGDKFAGKDYLDRQEAAEYIGLSIYFLENHRNDPNMPQFARVGRKVWYRKTDLDAFMERRKRAVGHLADLETLRQAGESRKSQEPTVAEVARAFGDTPAEEPKRGRGRPPKVVTKEFPPPEEAPLESVARDRAMRTLLLQDKVTKLASVEQLAELDDETGVFQVPGLGLLIKSRKASDSPPKK